MLPQLYVFTHRGVTHSIFIAFFVSTASLSLFTRGSIIARFNSRLNLKLNSAKPGKHTVLAAYLGALSHVLLDYSTTYGIPAFYPLSTSKYSGELFFYMDFIIMIFSIALALALYKQKIRETRLFLAAFLLLILALGGFRLIEKYDAASAASSLPSPILYPTANPFVWWMVAEDSRNNSIYIGRYDNLLKKDEFSAVYPRYNVVSTNSNFSFDEALVSASALPQVERFYWNSQKVSVTAVYNNTTESWLIRLKDPLRDAMMKSTPGFSNLSLAPGSVLNVSVSKHEVKTLY